MKCHLKNRDAVITDYVMDELSGDEARKFEEHYFECEVCFNDLQIARDAVGIIGKEGIPVPSGDRPSSHKYSASLLGKIFPQSLSVSRRAGIAVTAAVLLFIIVLTITNRITQHGIPEVDIAELTGPAFEPDPYLEDWIGEITRSRHALIDTVFSPRIGEIFHRENVVFRWNMNEEEPVSMKITTNIEEVIFSWTAEEPDLPNPSVRVDAATFPEPGLYYWRIEDDLEVLFIGKFYFLKDNGQ
jgi:hypothetical protein